MVRRRVSWPSPVVDCNWSIPEAESRVPSRQRQPRRRRWSPDDQRVHRWTENERIYRRSRRKKCPRKEEEEEERTGDENANRGRTRLKEEEEDAETHDARPLAITVPPGIDSHRALATRPFARDARNRCGRNDRARHRAPADEARKAASANIRMGTNRRRGSRRRRKDLRQLSGVQVRRSAAFCTRWLEAQKESQTGGGKERMTRGVPTKTTVEGVCRWWSKCRFHHRRRRCFHEWQFRHSRH